MEERFIEFTARQYDEGCSGAPGAPGGCPDENTWALLADDALAPSERRALIAHLSRCPPCRRIASQIISESASASEVSRPWIIRLRRPALYAAAAMIFVAVGVYFGVVRRGPDEAGLLARATRQIAAGQYDAAERELASAMERGQHSAAIRRLRGQALMGAALALATPGSAKLTSLGTVGVLPRRTKELPTIPVPPAQLEQALGLLRQAAEAEPNSPEGWQELGAALMVARRFDEAADAFGRWVQIEPDSAPAHNAQGLALYAAEHYSKAVAAFERASALARQVPAYVFNLAIACEEAGQLEEAQRHWRRYLELEPTGRDADEVRRWLSVLEKPTP
jgi:tetratricopeptide (TPR) repeat protein